MWLASLLGTGVLMLLLSDQGRNLPQISGGTGHGLRQSDLLEEI